MRDFLEDSLPFVGVITVSLVAVLILVLVPFVTVLHLRETRATNTILEEFRSGKPVIAYEVGRGKDKEIFESAPSFGYGIGYVHNSSQASATTVPAFTYSANGGGMGTAVVPTVVNAQMVIFIKGEER